MKPTENETELRKLLEPLIWQTIKVWDLQRFPGDGYAGATGTDVEAIVKAILPIITSDKQQLLKELLEHKVDYDAPLSKSGFTQGIPLSVIQNKLEGLS